MKIIDSLTSEINSDEIKLKYTYRLVNGTYKNSQAYGIEVEKEELKNGQVVNIERDSIERISNNRYKVNELLRLLHKNQASPIHLVEILGEYVDRYIYDFNDEENEKVIN